MSKTALAVFFINLTLILCNTLDVEKTFNNGGYNGLYKGKKNFLTSTNLTCPANPVCDLNSIRCRTNADCYSFLPVCCNAVFRNVTEAIRCCNPNATPAITTTPPGLRICPGNNPPPACRTPDVCTSDSECFANDMCCRTYFAGTLLNYSCCVPRERPAQCPATVIADTCSPANQVCGDNNQCATNQVCCGFTNPAIAPGLRCCVFPVCPPAIVAANLCITPDVCNNLNDRCDFGQICCHPGTLASPCCVRTPIAG